MHASNSIFIGAGEIWEFTNKVGLLVNYFNDVHTYESWADYAFKRACYKGYNGAHDDYIDEFERSVSKLFKLDSDRHYFDNAVDDLCEIAANFIETYGLEYWVYNAEDDDTQVVAEVSVERFVPYHYLVLFDSFNQNDLPDGYQVYP